MSKPIYDVSFQTLDGKSGTLRALFDSGSYYTIVRENRLPVGAAVIRNAVPKTFGTASQGGQLHIVAITSLILDLFGHPIQVEAMISPDLKGEFILGAGMMQAWDISITNDNGHTTINVGHDMNDPDIQTVE